jgi:hypothetical protein
MIESLGNIMVWLQTSEQNAGAATNNAEQILSQSVKMCKLLEDRLHDISSYCRSRALKTFAFLSEFVAFYRNRHDAA